MFNIKNNEELLKDRKKFHTIIVKLLYLGKCCRPDILLAVQFLCTRVKGPMKSDQDKLKKVLGYLKMTADLKRIIGSEPFDRVQVYIDAAFGSHDDGKPFRMYCLAGRHDNHRSMLEAEESDKRFDGGRAHGPIGPHD